MPYRIAVADPSPSVQKSVQLALPELEFRLYFFEEGSRLVEELSALRPDTVLISLSLPGTDAYATARAVAGVEVLRNVPLFFLKGTFELFDQDKAQGLTHDGVIRKPFDSETLAATVRDAIDRKVLPQTMPEELPSEEPPAGVPPGFRAPARPGQGSANGVGSLRDQVRELVRAEVLEMEREIEKRVRARILAELGKET